MDIVKERLIKGAYTGLGAVLSGAAGNTIENYTSSDKAVSAGLVAAGAAISVGSDEYLGRRNPMLSQAAEHAGYGMQAVGWDELAEQLNFKAMGQQTGANVINVSANASDGRSNGEETRARSRGRSQERISLETA